MKNKLIILLLVCSTINFTACKDVEAFKTKGIEVEATVQGIKKVKKKKSKTTSHYLQLAFYTQTEQTTANKNSIAPTGDYTTVEMYISKSRAKKFGTGDKVPIVYLPEDPQQIMLKEDIK
ncbi:MAG: hypothetical protein ACPGVB_02985 [Chitinophagales bacterium]